MLAKMAYKQAIKIPNIVVIQAFGPIVIRFICFIFLHEPYYQLFVSLYFILGFRQFAPSYCGEHKVPMLVFIYYTVLVNTKINIHKQTLPALQLSVLQQFIQKIQTLMSFHTSYQQNSIEQFKQETFSLIKQQSMRIKTNVKELEIKDEQIRLLKQTIEVLESEKQQTDRSNLLLKSKIETIMREVNEYNDNVVHRLYNENGELKKKVCELQPALQQNMQTVKRLSRQLQSAQQQLQTSQKQATHQKSLTESTISQLQSLQSQTQTNFQQLQQKQKQIAHLQSQLQQASVKQKSSQKQIDSLVAKCQETVSAYEKKIKNVKDGLVKKQEFVKVEIQMQKIGKVCDQLRRDIEKERREKNQVFIGVKIAKEKEVNKEIKDKAESCLLEADIRGLKDSITIGKKINEYESKYAEYFEQITQNMRKLKQQRDQLQKKLQLQIQKTEQCQKQLSQKQCLLQTQNSQLQLLSQSVTTRTQQIESTYQSKILQLSIKIKKQEKALQSLTQKESQFSSLQQQYQKLYQQNQEMKQSLTNTIQQYKKQNTRLATEVQELIRLCDQNICARNSMNCLKYVIGNLVAVIWFLYKELTRNREARRKLFLPFILFYFHTRFALKDNLRKNKLFKFRSCVYMVIAIKRMEKGAAEIHSQGLIRYIERAIKYKAKIQDYSDFLENLLQKALKNEKDITELLKQNKHLYKWNCLHNYQKINIPINWYSKILEKHQQ